MKRAAKRALPLLLIPILVGAGLLLDGGRQYLAISGGICLCALAFFYAGLENRRIGARRMVITAILTALSTLGRLIPLFQPITAVTVLGGMHLGGQAGFLIGSFSALLSNFAFGQGPWTPFQMLAWGMIGLIAGAAGGILKRSRAALLTFGVLSGLLYSLIMDVFTVVWGSGTFSPGLYLTAIMTALPHTVTYALSNLVFLFLLASPMGEKLERMRVKYGI